MTTTTILQKAAWSGDNGNSEAVEGGSSKTWQGSAKTTGLPGSGKAHRSRSWFLLFPFVDSAEFLP